MRRRPSRPLRVGLTGGIGSGKSTVGQMLAALGACLIDADQISREVTGPQGAAMAAIRSTFGAEYVDACGALDRARMRQLLFSQPQARARLEGIIHPLVAAHGDSRAQQGLAAGAGLIVHDIPLLAESGPSGPWARRLDAVVVVDCLAETQIERVIRRSGLAREQVQGIIASQASRSARRALADVVLANEADGTLQQLQAEVRQMARWVGL